MRKIYVDGNGVSDTVEPIGVGERVLVSIKGEVELEVLGTDSFDTRTPCESCPFDNAVISAIIPRCPRLYPGDWDYNNSYDGYTCICSAVIPVSPGDVMEEL